MKKILFLLIALLTAVMFSGCGLDGNPTPKDISAKESIYGGEATLVKLMDELKNMPELKGKDLKIFQSIYIDENMIQDRYIHNIKINLLKPGTVKDVVAYEYSTAKEKKWVGPHPVKVSGGGDITPNLVPFNEVPFKSVPSICKQTREKTADLKEVELNVVLLELDDKDLHPYWSVQFTGKKGESTIRGHVDFDLQGNMQKYDQYVDGEKK